MAVYDCSICGNDIGVFAHKEKTKDARFMCGDCSKKARMGFPFGLHTLEEYSAHVNQLAPGHSAADKAAEGRRIYETLLKGRINIKQIDPPGAVFRFLAKKNIDDSVKRYGQNNLGIWAIEEYGLILIRETDSVALILKEENARYLVYRYSELSSYSLQKVENSTDDDNSSVSLYIEMSFNGLAASDIISVEIPLSNVYKKFDSYFGQIVGGDMTEYDRRADAILGGMAAG